MGELPLKPGHALGLAVLAAIKMLGGETLDFDDDHKSAGIVDRLAVHCLPYTARSYVTAMTHRLRYDGMEVACGAMENAIGDDTAARLMGCLDALRADLTLPMRQHAATRAADLNDDDNNSIG